jgi:glycosyltransferase involved in cell wall biosynthesis
LWFLVRALRTHRPLIVHTHTAKAGVLGRIAAVVTRVPIRVHTFHGHVLHGYFSPRMTKLVVLVERLLARATTYTVAVGEQVRTDLIEARIAKANRSRVVAPGVARPPQQDRAAARASIGLHGDELGVVFVGRLTKIKRPERFVELARTLADRLPNARFVIVGDGPLRAELEAGASDVGNLTFAGWRGDMAEVYAASDLIVLTSDNEGMPVALIEAAMQGVPAIATDVGAVRQVVADGVSGVVVPVGDAERFAAAVERVARDPELRAEMGRSAALRAEQLFGERRLVTDYEELYDELIDELTRGRRRRRG